jgi:hypothetical protein
MGPSGWRSCANMKRPGGWWNMPLTHGGEGNGTDPSKRCLRFIFPGGCPPLRLRPLQVLPCSLRRAGYLLWPSPRAAASAGLLAHRGRARGELRALTGVGWDGNEGRKLKREAAARCEVTRRSLVWVVRPTDQGWTR